MLSGWTETQGSSCFMGFLPPSCSCERLKFLFDNSASCKLFYRRCPVLLFCSYPGKAHQKWLSLKEIRREVQRKPTSKALRTQSKAGREKEGGQAERERDLLTGKSKCWDISYKFLSHTFIFFSRFPQWANISLLPIVILSHSRSFASSPLKPVTPPILPRVFLEVNEKRNPNRLPL